MSKKLAAKASLIQLPPARPAAIPAGQPEAPIMPSSPATADFESPPLLGHAASPDRRPKTAPGTMAVFMATQSAAVREAEELKIKLRTFEGAVPMRTLDPRQVRPSRWANRHADALADAAYHELKTDIANAGKNIQPICVRPTGDGGPFDFEVVYGHRRHRACLDLGIPVQAVIADVDDKGLFEAMERENRARKNLSAWEQGMMYRRALDSGLYASQRKLAEAIGVDLSLISKSLTLARLPETVIAAFTSPLDVQFRWAQPLSEALQRDPEGLTSRAKSIAADRGVLTSKQILDSLLNPKAQVLNGSTPSSAVRIGTVGKGASLTLEANGRALLRFDSGVLTPQRQQALVAWLETQLSTGS